MSKFLTRFVAFLLVPCLLTDAVSVSAFANAPGASQMSPIQSLFDREALAALAISSIQQPYERKIFTSFWLAPLKLFEALAGLTVANKLLPSDSVNLELLPEGKTNKGIAALDKKRRWYPTFPPQVINILQTDYLFKDLEEFAPVRRKKINELLYGSPFLPGLPKKDQLAYCVRRTTIKGLQEVLRYGPKTLKSQTSLDRVLTDDKSAGALLAGMGAWTFGVRQKDFMLVVLQINKSINKTTDRAVISEGDIVKIVALRRDATLVDITSLLKRPDIALSSSLDASRASGKPVRSSGPIIAKMHNFDLYGKDQDTHTDGSEIWMRQDSFTEGNPLARFKTIVFQEDEPSASGSPDQKPESRRIAKRRARKQRLSSADPEVIRLTKQATELRKKRMLDEAINLLDQALAIEPLNPITLTIKAGIYIELRRFSDALSLIDEAQKTDPHSVKIYMIRAHALSGLGRFDEAIEMYRKSLTLWPNDIKTYLTAVHAFHAKKDYEGARRFAVPIILKDDTYTSPQEGLWLSQLLHDLRLSNRALKIITHLKASFPALPGLQSLEKEIKKDVLRWERNKKLSSEGTQELAENEQASTRAPEPPKFRLTFQASLNRAA